MNAVRKAEIQNIHAAQAAVHFDAAISVVEKWIEILKAEIRVECSARRPLGKRVTPLTRRVNEAVVHGRKLRPDDATSIDATIARYTALIESHRIASPIARLEPALPDESLLPLVVQILGALALAWILAMAHAG